MKNAAYIWGFVTINREKSTSYSEVDLLLLAGVVIFVCFGESSLWKVWTKGFTVRRCTSTKKKIGFFLCCKLS